MAGVLVADMKHEDYQFIVESVQEEIDLAKLQGLEVTRKLANGWNHNENMKWDTMAISNETASKLIANEFKTFDEFSEFNLRNESENQKIEILYRKIPNKNREEDIYIIETIFINE